VRNRNRGLAFWAFAAVLAAATCAGIVLFPRALEPGREERAGITLNLLADSGDGTRSNDWYTEQSTAGSASIDNGLRVRAFATGRMIVSRPLPVFRHECYAIRTLATAALNDVFVTVYNEDVSHYLQWRELIRADSPRPMSIRFQSQGEARVVIAFHGRIGAVLTLAAVRLERLGRDTVCPANHPGSGNDLLTASRESP
jgi:hypothetical protein